MNRKYDCIVIGGGHNGLGNAAYLARAGKRVLVLERRHVLGGGAATEAGFPRLQIFSLLVRRFAAASGDHSRIGSTKTWIGNPAARWDVHADAGRRLSLARERSCEDAARDRAAFQTRRGSLRRIRQGHGRDGPLRQTCDEYDAARSHFVEPEGIDGTDDDGPTVSEAVSRKQIQSGA